MKTRPKQLLGYLPLDILFPAITFDPGVAGQSKLMGENLEGAWAEFSNLS